MGIALSTLGDVYLEMAQAAGVAPELLHRVTAVAPAVWTLCPTMAP